MRFKKIFASILSLSLLLTGCNRVSIPTNADTAFRNFTLNLFQQDVASSTLGLHYTIQHPENYGIDNSSITFGSFNTDPTDNLAAIENCQATLNKFPYKKLCRENQITYDVLSYHLKIAKEGASYSLYDEPLSPVTGIHAQLPVLLAEYQFTSEADVKTYLALLKTTSDYFSSLIEFEQKKSNAGLFMSENTANAVLEQCNAFVSMGEGNYLLSTFEERLNALDEISQATKTNYISQNRQQIFHSVIPAYEQLISAINELKGSDKNSQGLCYLPKGKDYYSFLVARETGSSHTIEELLTMTQSQVSDDLLAMQDIVTKHPNVIEETSASISASPDSILKDLEDKIDLAFPTPETVNVEIKYVPSALEPYLSPAFYLIPAIDNTTENVIYINQAHTLDDIHLFTTLAHEGYPGHLYQTTYYAGQNPDPLRNLFNFKGYVEGWATYAEMCSYYLSSLDKPSATLLQKNNSLILGLYALADIGIHYGGWNLERTVQFFKTYGIDNENIVLEIYDTIIGDPANYLSYYVGYLEILELKREAMEREGNDFSQKEFHQKILEVGPAPFEIVRKYFTPQSTHLQ